MCVYLSCQLLQFTLIFNERFFSRQLDICISIRCAELIVVNFKDTLETLPKCSKFANISKGLHTFASGKVEKNTLKTVGNLRNLKNRI